MDLEDIKQRYPGLYIAVQNVQRPWGCADCPFATVSEGHDPPNPADLDEGHYDCRLMCRPGIWGENVACQTIDWQRLAKKELEALVQRAGK